MEDKNKVRPVRTDERVYFPGRDPFREYMDALARDEAERRMAFSAMENDVNDALSSARASMVISVLALAANVILTILVR